MAAEERVSLPAPSAATTLNAPTAPVVDGKVKKSRQMLAAAGLTATLAWLDVILVALVVAFTFVTAAFPVSNTDFYQFLAVGRLIVQGKYVFGEDPFTFTSQGVYWANQSWLFDVGLYALYSLPKGAALVVIVKAALLAGLSIVMLATARPPRTSLWLPACCVCLAVLAASPRFILQPACMSMLLLALTVWLLRRPLAVEGVSLRTWWLLPALCALWVNLDQWFLLGPLSVGLFLLASFLQRRFGPATEGSEIPSATALRSLVYVFVACLAACLVSPHHYHALVLPEAMGFSEAGYILGEDGQFRSLFATPWDIPNGVYYHPNLGLSSAGLAYFPVLLLCIVSFLVNRPGFRWWRALLTAALAIVSAIHGRAIPFFAIVAGPVMALNFVDFTTRHYGALLAWNENQRRWALAGRALTALLGIVMVVVAVPGWLQAKPTEQRRFGFDVVTDESLRHAAEHLAELRKEGRLADDKWFNTSPDVVHYLAWFGDSSRGFVDQRLSLFGGAAEDYRRVREGLAHPFDPKETDKTPWRAVFTTRKVRIVIFHAANLSGGSGDVILFMTMAASPEEWTPLFLEGGTAIFAWNDPTVKRSQDLDGLVVNLQAEAYGPKAKQAPNNRPKTEPEIQPWYQSLWKPEPRHSVAADDAQLHYIYYDAGVNAYRRLALKNLQTRQNALRAAMVSFPLSLMRNQVPDLSNLRPENILIPDGDATACLYIALRSARRALEHNPNDARTHLLLGHIYYLFYTERLEGADLRSIELLGRIRRSAAATHLHQAVELDPNLTQGHRLLFDLYMRLGMFDLAVKHLGEFRRCVEREGPLAGDKPGDFEKRLEAIGKELEAREKQLASIKSLYNIHAPGSEPPQKRARLAYPEVPGQGVGLAETALAAYQEIKIEELGKEEAAEAVQQWIDLLFDMGRLADVREGLTPKLQPLLGPHHRLGLPAYDWFEARLAAASGDYDEAIAAFTRMAEKRAPGLAMDENTRLLVTQAGKYLAQAMVQDTGRILCPQLLPAEVTNYFLRRPLWDYRFGPGMVSQTCSMVFAYRHLTAQLQILPGWLAFEAGQNERAENLFLHTTVGRRLVERDLRPLGLLALSDPFNGSATYLAIALASRESPAYFDVEHLAEIDLYKLKRNKALPARH